jgi:recombination protein RecA
MVDNNALNRALEAIRKNYGEAMVRNGSDYDTPLRISTGALELDLITKGGFPIGRWSHLYGGNFSAKTLIALRAIGNAQRMGQTAAYYNTEKQFDPVWAAKLGVDVDSLNVVDTTIIEEIGAIMETLLPEVDLHVIDSIPAAISLDELAAETSDWLPGIGARAWGKALRRANQSFDQERNTVLMINHVATAFGKYMAGDEPKGGRLLEYLSSLSLEFRRSSWLFRDKNGNLKGEGASEENLSGDKTPAGIEFAVRVKKSRVSVPFLPARMRLDFASGEIDDMWSVTKAAILYGVANQYAKGRFEMEGGEKLHGEGQLREYIEAHPEFKEKVIEAITKEAG